MGNERSTEAGKRFAGYQIYDQHYEKVGKVDDLFVDENDQPEYIGFQTGLFGGPSALIPMDIVRVNDARELVEVAANKETIKNAPSVGDDAEITADFEDRVYAHFGATHEPSSTDRGGYGAHDGDDPDVDVDYGQRSQETGAASTAPTEHEEYPTGTTGDARHHEQPRPEAEPVVEPRASGRAYDRDTGTERREPVAGETGHADKGTHSPRRPDRELEETGRVGPGMKMGDTESGVIRGHAADNEGIARRQGSDLEDEDEIRVQRSEEELRAGTRERAAGSMKVRKRVRIDRERIEVPVKHEEVTVERVPVSGGATEAQIGDDEVSMPVIEDEVVVQKRTVAKEEIRIRKDVVDDIEVVEEDVRREEIEIEDDTGRRKE